MEIEELKGITIGLTEGLNSVMRILSKHGVPMTEWENDPERPKADKYGQYDLQDVYVWLGY